ncbi:MAG TPA: hypothetical protein VN665_01440, partial [Candidatus Paceibacterota bacterium]|nr:hypothetical protein [Candidatus Paceibacterota bacterium]
RHSKLWVGPAEEIKAYYAKLFVESMDLSGVDTVIELGGGFGYHSYLLQQKYPDKKFIVGEFSPNARKVGESVTKGISFVPFNFYSDWSILEGSKGAAVFTVHAVEMLADAKLFFDAIAPYKANFDSLTLFEPIYETGTDELSKLRQKYIEVNQYNKNMNEFLTDAQVERDFFGFNPLFPVSRIPVPL